MTTSNSFIRKEQQITSVRLVSSGNITATYYNGTNNDGIGATLTVAAASLTVDSVATAVNDRILLIGQTNGYENGIYEVTSIGTTVVLTRAVDFQSIEQMKPGYFIPVEAGTEFNGSIFGIVEPQVGVIGTDSITFANAAASPDIVTLTNTGLRIYNPAGTFLNTLTFSSAITAARTFTIVTGDAARTLTFTGNATLNQDVDTTASPSFVNVNAGASGTAGYLASFPAAAANGELRLVAANNAGGDFDTYISNAASVGQNQTISIPDAGAATANFLIDEGAANIKAFQQFVGLSNVLLYGTGTWTVTRGAQGNYYARHSAADETSIIGIDITPEIRVAASKGFRLDSFDVIYGIGTAAMDAHTMTLDRIEYADGVAVSVNSIAITITLATTNQANPHLTNGTVDSPAFDVTADSKYVMEITANNSATSVYDFYGIMLRFSKTIG